MDAADPDGGSHSAGHRCQWNTTIYTHDFGPHRINFTKQETYSFLVQEKLLPEVVTPVQVQGARKCPKWLIPFRSAAS